MRFRSRDWNGDGVEVALIDSGVNNEDLRLQNAQVDGWSVAVNASGHAQLASDFQDTHGHGTEMAAVLFRDAPGIQLKAIKVCANGLQTSPEALAAGVETALRHGAKIVVVALSTSDPGRMELLRAASSMAAEAGALLVTCAHPLGQPSFPADLPESIAVLSHPDCPQGRFFCFSQASGQPNDWTALRGTFLTHGYTHGESPAYYGASLAAASVGARLACLAQALPDASAPDLVQRLRSQSLSPDAELGFA